MPQANRRGRRFAVAALLAVAGLAISPAPVRADPKGDYLAAVDRMQRVRFWHEERSSTSGERATRDVALPNRMREQQSKNPSGPPTSFIAIGDTMWIMDQRGRVTDKMTLPAALNHGPAGELLLFKQASAFKDAGSGSVGGVRTHAIRMEIAPMGFKMTAILDIGVADGLPHRLVRKAQIAGDDSIIFSKFGVPVSIEPPR